MFAWDVIQEPIDLEEDDDQPAQKISTVTGASEVEESLEDQGAPSDQDEEHEVSGDSAPEIQSDLTIDAKEAGLQGENDGKQEEEENNPGCNIGRNSGRVGAVVDPAHAEKTNALVQEDCSCYFVFESVFSFKES